MIQSKTSKDFEQCDKSSVEIQVRLVTQSYTNTDGQVPKVTERCQGQSMIPTGN